jgi:hypothetical protein
MHKYMLVTWLILAICITLTNTNNFSPGHYNIKLEHNSLSWEKTI